MELLNVTNNPSAVCGFYDSIFWEQPYGAAYPSTFCRPYEAVKDDLICKIKVEEVAQKTFDQAQLIPTEMILCCIGVGVILSSALFVGVRNYLATVPELPFARSTEK